MPLSPTAEISVPVYPVVVENIKCEPRPNSPAISDDKCDDPIVSANLSDSQILDSDDEEHGKLLPDLSLVA